MPNLPPPIAAGQSNAPTTPMGQPRSIIGPATNYYPADSIISNRIRNLSTLNVDRFPSDLPKYHFTIIQNEWAYTRGRLTAERIFKIPFPRELLDKSEVNYDTNFNYLSIVSAALSDASLGLANRTASTVTTALGSVAGITINNIRSVTLQVPDFKTHQLSWHFAPKTQQEADNIQRIIFALKKGMAPRKVRRTLNLVLQFPKVYTMYFSPNVQHLFKFKPCVLSTLVVDYGGGNPAPAFFSSDGSNKNPPESVVISTNWIELEYWLDHESQAMTDFKIDQFGLPTTDPLDGMSWYNYNNSPNWFVRRSRESRIDGENNAPNPDPNIPRYPIE